MATTHSRPPISRIARTASDEGPATIRTLHVSDLRISLDGLAAAIAREREIYLVGDASVGREALLAAHEHRPHVVLVDMAIDDALPLIADVLLIDPGLRVIAYGVRGGEEAIVTLARAGVAGCMLAESTFHDLIGAVRAVAGGAIACSPGVGEILFRRIANSLDPRDPPGRGDRPRLTLREEEILRLVTQGLSNKEVAHVLHLQVPTVKNHVHSILAKVGVQSRRDLSAWTSVYHAPVMAPPNLPRLVAN